VNSEIIILPSTFKSPRYFNGLWLSQRLRWTEEDIALLASAVDLKINYNDAANTLGRDPKTIFHKAGELFSYWRLPTEWKKKFLQYKLKTRQHKDALQYPYIVKPDDKYSDLIAVNNLVSKSLPGREDVCQDIMLALWESRTSLKELKDDQKKTGPQERIFLPYARKGRQFHLDFSLIPDF